MVGQLHCVGEGRGETGREGLQLQGGREGVEIGLLHPQQPA